MAPVPKALVLVLNSGSSSIKFGVFEVGKEQHGRTSAVSTCSGQVERIGVAAGSKVIVRAKGRKAEKECPTVADHSEALARIVEALEREADLDAGRIAAVGHRVVHGGVDFSAPAVVDDEVEAAIEKNAALAPLHNPVNLLGIREGRRGLFGHCPHVAVFDTAFHATMPAASYRYAVPKAWYEDHGVRKYGFHGTSYAYVCDKVRAELGDERSENLVVCHLGNGASMACVKDGKCLDTTMGLTPLEGLVMGTRCGDVDPSLCAFLNRKLDMSAADVDAALNKKSGLLGVSGVSSDMREVYEAALQGNPDAQLARQLAVERIRKYLGAYLVKLDGRLDALVFTAGIGEHDADLRAKVCAGLDTLGIAIDPAANTAAAGSLVDVSASGSRTKVFVAATNEEEAIATQTAAAAGIFNK